MEISESRINAFFMCGRGEGRKEGRERRRMTFLVAVYGEWSGSVQHWWSDKSIR